MKILYLNGSMTGNSDFFTKKFLEIEKQKHPKISIKEINLNQKLSSSVLQSDNMKKWFEDSQEWIDMVLWADKIYLCCGMINYGFSTVVKNWIDKIVAPRLTFSYTANGVEKPLKDKFSQKEFQVIYSSGSLISSYPPSIQDYKNFLCYVLCFIGFDEKKMKFEWIDGLNAPENYGKTNEQIWQERYSKK